MGQESLQILIVMVVYMAAVIGIGIFFARRANADTEKFFLGGRSLGPWVSAMSAEASDMSGWLLMGLPGVAYWCGLADAFWTAAGLAVGTYINWLVVSKRLRRYSIAANNAITLPEFFSNRFHEKKKVIMGISAAFILVFFTVYAASCLVTCGKLFSTLFGAPYITMMLVGAAFVLIYTLHDIGKAIDHEMEGSHVEIGGEIAKKFRESDLIINAILAHHGDVEPKSVEAVLVSAADAVSAARPGARRETLESYLKRLTRLEEISESFNGVEKCYAVQAGREIRIMVKPEVIDDASARSQRTWTAG